jgi:hypothetical protein
MADPVMAVKLDQSKRFLEVKKLLELNFYKHGDICDLPYVAQALWADWGTDFNDQICKPNGLNLTDQGDNIWKFIKYP